MISNAKVPELLTSWRSNSSVMKVVDWPPAYWKHVPMLSRFPTFQWGWMVPLNFRRLKNKSKYVEWVFYQVPYMHRQALLILCVHAREKNNTNISFRPHQKWKLRFRNGKPNMHLHTSQGAPKKHT